MVTLHYDKGVLILCVPYNAACIAEIKKAISSKSRTWNPNLKTWYIKPDYITVLTEILRKHFDLCEISTSPNIPRPLIISNELQGDRDESNGA
jgi:hypothetical protein